MTTIFNVFDQLSQILARLDPRGMQQLKASEPMQKHFDTLAEKSKSHQLTESEKDELAHYVVLERLMRMAKIKVGKFSM